MKSVYFLLLLLTLTSCKDSQKRKISNLVNEWDGKEIVFPSSSVFMVQAKDTVDFPINSADYKIVAYVDSVGCMSCKLQLSRWKDFISEIDSLTGYFIPFVFYFHQKDINELRYITRRDNFEYPICIDIEDKFNSLNHFPDKMEFQTFLIDINNKVVAIGNPIHNSKVKELYCKILRGKDSEISKIAMTEVSVDSAGIDFGSFPKEVKQERNFVLTNTGKDMLVIQDVVTSCGCTKVSYSKAPIRSGEQTELTVTYEAEKAEHFNKTVTVYCNSNLSPLKLKIKGKAK